MEPLFGDPFDLNGDGITTPFEEMLGLGILDEMEREDRRKQRDIFTDDECVEFEDDDFDSEDY